MKDKIAYTEDIATGSGFEVRVEEHILDNKAEIILRFENPGNCVLHWGLRRNPYSPWQAPPQALWPEGSRAFDGTAVQTPLTDRHGPGETTFKLELPMGFSLFEFVLFFPEEDRWDNNHGRNYSFEIQWDRGAKPAESSLGGPEIAGLASEIIERETGKHSWTLMHRFNLCYDLLDRIKSDSLDGMALIFVWLRYSAVRQLDWQRNYNTKPRELGHAMDRLTLKLADRYLKEKGEHEIIRLIMTTLGRGGNAQRVRDEVLNIMHRHNIKEVSGHFMEEWHQKLHNNTTPDDVVICEAYLEFLRSGGSLDLFYQRLNEGGITKGRLESYERPIRSHPDFIPHLKDVLIRDFEHFLGILKEVHSGADLGIAIKASRYLFDAETHALMDFLWSHQSDSDINPLVKKIAESRKRLSGMFEGPSYKIRDLLFLDVALEDFLRTVVERNLGQLSDDSLAELLEAVLQSVCLSDGDVEFQRCLDHWQRLKQLPRFGKDWSLHAAALVDRLRRAVGSFIDRYHLLLQPKAEFLGRAFRADSWAIDLFSEEVLRGRPAFVLSMILRYLDPVLRRNAGLGRWQVISRGHGTGEVKVVGTLKSVQGGVFMTPVVLIADGITGDEEIPQGVAAIVTPEVIDSLSHLAIRARNDGVLFAICYDTETLESLKSLSGHRLSLTVKNTGEIGFEESRDEAGAPRPVRAGIKAISRLAGFTAYAAPMSDFSDQNVGYKSIKLKDVRGKLPDWINLPPSAALPFGVFEKVLSLRNNRGVSKRYEELTKRVKDTDAEEREGVLSELRDTVLSLEAPEELVPSLRKVVEAAGLAWPREWNEAWMCIKRVWSSKWNDRAYLSRMANGIPDEALQMSVLIQSVVESDYSFVIHTVNPFTGVRDEVYAEVVLGLGETLAANYPGRALSFTCGKGGGTPGLLSLPSKSTGLYGGGLIFRSDSNGEDLSGYAGAGLYDSFVLPPPRRTNLDYTREPLVWDKGFRERLLVDIARIGSSVEEAMESPQDIEGAYAKGKYFVVQTRPQVGVDNV